MKRSAGRAANGFTMVEVMMAIVVFLTAATGLLAFEHVLMRSNVAASDTTAATFLGRYWIERGRLESLMWNQTGSTDLIAARVPLLAEISAGVGIQGDTTNWLAVTGAGGVAYPFNRYLQRWTPALEPGDPGYGDYGEFCVQYRLTVLVPDEMLRMETRVLWYKPDGGRPATGSLAWTCPADLLADSPDRVRVHLVQFATTLWRNAL